MGKVARWKLAPDTVIDVSGNKLKSNSGRVARDASLAGLGIAYLPSYLVEDDIHEGTLVPLLEDHVDIDLPLHLLYPATHSHMAKIRTFIDICNERVSEAAV